MVMMLKRAAAMMGMVVMLPIAYMLATGNLSASDAGTRAAITLIAVLAIRRVLGHMAFLDDGPIGAPAPSSETAEMDRATTERASSAVVSDGPV